MRENRPRVRSPAAGASVNGSVVEKTVREQRIEQGVVAAQGVSDSRIVEERAGEIEPSDPGGSILTAHGEQADVLVILARPPQDGVAEQR